MLNRTIAETNPPAKGSAKGRIRLLMRSFMPSMANWAMLSW